MKPIRVWLAVDQDGRACLYRERPRYDAPFAEWHAKDKHGGYICLPVAMPNLAGQCLEVDVVLPKKPESGWVPPCPDRDDEVALRKHEKEKFL